jgi:site-specific recombinase XerD
MEYNLIDRFVEEEQRKGKDTATLQRYRRDLHEFAYCLRAVCFHSSLFTANRETATTYSESLRIRGYTPQTRRRRLRSVHAFYAWLHRSGRMPFNPFRRSSRQRKGAA